MCSPSGPTPTAPERRPLELVERELCELSAHMAVGMARWLRLVAEFDEREGWAEWGVYSMAHWLSWRCSVALRAAREQVRVARLLKGLPLIMEAFEAGALSYSKVRALTRVASPANEEYLLMLARHATGAQLEKIVAGYRGVLSATTEGAQRAHDRRFLVYSHDDDGSLLIQARIPADEGAIFLAALADAEQAAQRDAEVADTADSDDAYGSAEQDSDYVGQSGSAEPQEHAVAEMPAARRADALMTLARAQLASDRAAHVDGDPVELVVHVDVQTLADETVQERSELAHGPTLAPETVRRLGCDAGVARIIERDGRPLTVGRRTRTIPPALKRALRDCDPECRFPGCSHRRYLHAHHIHHWARGGPTNIDNLIQLCTHHHRLVHEGGFTIERVSGNGRGTVRFVRPDGRPVPERPPTTRPTGPGLQQQHRQRGIPITPTTSLPLSAGDPVDYGMAVEGLLQEDGRLRPAPAPDSPTASGPDPNRPPPASPAPSGAAPASPPAKSPPADDPDAKSPPADGPPADNPPADS